MGVPKIDKRSKDDILIKLKELTKFYIPEYRMDDENTDAGMAILKIYSKMLGESVKRLNRVLDKNFIEYLNVLGASSHAPQPARIPVVFNVDKTYKTPVFIPGGTVLNAVLATGDMVKFETDSNISATNAELTAVYETILSMNKVIDVSEILEQREPLKLFYPLEDNYPVQEQETDDEFSGIYFGFNLPIGRGIFSLFFHFENNDLLNGKLNNVKWEYYSAKLQEWSRLEVVDETKNLTTTGILLFNSTNDFGMKKMFDKELYWIRVQVKSDINSLDVADFSVLQGIYQNAVWATQLEKVINEVPIMYNADYNEYTGESGMSFKLLKRFVYNEEVWINENNSLSEQSKIELKDLEMYEINEVKNNEDEIIEFWVKWKAVDFIGKSDSKMRNYEIDRANGIIKFGNGINGRALPDENGIVRVNYKFGGGVKGNIEPDGLRSISGIVPGIASVNNPIEGQGGCEEDSLEDTIKRGTKIFRHRQRAVTKDDYEAIAMQEVRGIAKINCMTNYLKYKPGKPGCVTMVVVPANNSKMPIPDENMKKRIKESLIMNCSNITASEDNIYAVNPVYVKVGIRADIIVDRLDKIQEIESMAIYELDKFLHPVTGGDEGSGWEFGKLPHISDFYKILERINGVKYIEDLEVVLTERDKKILVKQGIVENYQSFTMPYNIVCSGEHDIRSEVRICDSAFRFK